LPKALADKSKQVPILTGLILIGGLIGAVTASLLIFLTSSWLDVFFKTNVFDGLVFYICAWSFLSTMNALMVETNRGLLQIKVAIIANGLITSSLVCLGLLLAQSLAWHIGLDTLIAAYCVASLLSVILSFWALVRHGYMTYHGFNFVEMKEKLPEVMSLAKLTFATSFMLIIINQSSIWIVSHQLTLQDVGYFGLVIRLMGLLGTPFVILSSFMPPIISSLFAKGDYHKIVKVGRAVIQGLLVYGVIILLFWWNFGEWFILTFFGESYLLVSSLMMLMIYGVIVRFLFGLKGAVVGHIILTTLPAIISFIIMRQELGEKL